jgi:hypothetical protein
MEVRNVGFGAVKASAIKKGMLFEKTGTKPGTRGYETLQVLDIQKSKRVERKLQIGYIPECHDKTYTCSIFKAKVNDMLPFDLVGWAKRSKKV